MTNYKMGTNSINIKKIHINSIIYKTNINIKYIITKYVLKSFKITNIFNFLI